MVPKWTDWECPSDVGTTSPYVAWHNLKIQIRGDDETAFIETPLNKGAALQQATPVGETFTEVFQNEGAPMRTPAKNTAFWGNLSAMGPTADWAPQGTAPKVGADTVILGVIDRGAPLHHRRLNAGGTDANSRILAAWQQDADLKEDDCGSLVQPFLPCGREYYKCEIDDAITTARQNGAIDEHLFNTKLGLVKMEGPNAPRSLARRQSHGAAVLDVAAGGDLPDNVYVIVVNMPDRATIGASGTFLNYYASLAMWRIARIAEWIWDANVADWDGKHGHRTCFPVNVNLSFGKNAGPIAGQSFLQRSIRAIRSLPRWRNVPFEVALPVGNDNLEQGFAEIALGSGDPGKVGWRVPPADQTDNVLEIWTEPVRNGAQLAIEVAPPGAGASLVGSKPLTSDPAITSWRRLQVGDAPGPNNENVRGAMYARAFPVPSDPSLVRLQITVFLLPTLDNTSPDKITPPGLWEVSLGPFSEHALDVTLAVQTDQSTGPDGGTGLRSRLVHPGYDRHLPNGRRRDSYAYPFATPPVDQDNGGVVLRHGSMNASSSMEEIVAISAHRKMDGRPADYAATGFRNRSDVRRPAASLPSETGAAHYGVIAAGAAGGSAIPISGTSFACAMASRRIIVHMADLLKRDMAGGHLAGFTARDWLQIAAAREDPSPAPQLPQAKVGAGRMSFAVGDEARWRRL